MATRARLFDVSHSFADVVLSPLLGCASETVLFKKRVSGVRARPSFRCRMTQKV